MRDPRNQIWTYDLCVASQVDDTADGGNPANHLGMHFSNSVNSGISYLSTGAYHLECFFSLLFFPKCASAPNTKIPPSGQQGISRDGRGHTYHFKRGNVRHGWQ